MSRAGQAASGRTNCFLDSDLDNDIFPSAEGKLVTLSCSERTSAAFSRMCLSCPSLVLNDPHLCVSFFVVVILYCSGVCAGVCCVRVFVRVLFFLTPWYLPVRPLPRPLCTRSRCPTLSHRSLVG